MKTLTVDSLFQAYGKHEVLRGVFLEIHQGRVTGLLGPNGSGKTTLFSCIQGSLAKKAGAIFVEGRPIADRDAWKYCAMLPQGSFLPQDLSCDKAASLFVGPEILGNNSLYIVDRFLAPLRSQKISALSGGQRRYLETILVCSLGRPFVILDEPFAEIEPLHISRLFSIIKGLLAHTGFLLTDHLHQSIREIADDLYVMDQGQVKACKNDTASLRASGYYPIPLHPAARIL